MSYTKTNWQNGVTPINETNMNKIEDELYTLDGAVTTLDNDKADISSLSTVATTGSYDDLTDKPIVNADSVETDEAYSCNYVNSLMSSLSNVVKTITIADSQSVSAGATGSYFIGNFDRKEPLLLDIVASGTNREFGNFFYIYRSNQYHYRAVELAKTQYSRDDKFTISFTNNSLGLTVNVANTGSTNGNVTIYATFLHKTEE